MKFPQIGIIAKPVKHQVSSMGHIERALVRAGYRVRLSYDATAPEDVVVCWGWGKAKEVRVVNPDAVILCLDHGYTLERKQFINTGWSVPSMRFGLNGFAEHAWVRDDGARLRAMGWDKELAPVRVRGSFGKRALVLGQVYGDAMIVDHVEDYGAWLRGVVDQLQREGWDTTFRPHPIMVARRTTEKYGNLGRVSAGGSLGEDLGHTDMAAAMNSNGLVQAYMAGLEVRAWNKGTMLSPLMSGPGETIPGDEHERYLWASRLAWAQWSYEELENGTWLKHHAPIMHRLVETGEARPWHDRRI